MLGIIISLQWQRPYLTGRTFKVLTDHALNKYFNNQAKLSRRQVCWLEILAEYDIQFEYVPGCKHSAPDELSHRPQMYNILCIDGDKALQEAIAIDQKTSIDPTVTQNIIEGTAQGDGYTLQNGILCKEDNNRVCIVIPSDALDVTKYILKQFHESVLGGHLGAGKLSCLVSDRFAWTGIESAVRNYCLQCSTC